MADEPEIATTPPAAPAPPAPRWYRRRYRGATPLGWLRRILLGLLALIAAVWVILFVTKGRFLKSTFERVVGRLTDRTVTVRGDFQLYFAPLDIKFLAEGITISNPAWATRPNLFDAKRIDTRIAPLSLIFGKRRMRWLDLSDAAIDLEWNAAHDRNTWTFGEKKGGKRLEFPIIGRATVAGTTLRYLDSRLRLETDLKFETITSRDARIGDAVHFTGTGTVRATPFRLSGALMSPDATVARGKNQLLLRAFAAHNRIDVTGTLPSIAEIEDVPLKVEARGRNVAELLGIIGVVTPATRAYRLNAQLVKSGIDYTFTGLTGRFGDSDIAGRFTVSQTEPKVHIDAALTTRRLDIIDVAPFIGYNPDIVATKGAVAAAAATGAAPARVMPDAPLNIEAMKAFDADLNWRVGIVRSKNVPISNIALTLKLKDQVLTLSPLTMTMSRGDVAADVTIDTRRRPAHTTYDIRLASTPMGRLLAGFGVAEAGTTGTIKGRVQLAGDGDTVHDSLSSANGRIAFTMPQGTFWTRNVQLAELDIGTFVQKLIQDKLKKPVTINCGAIAFTVRNGIAAADPILIDTEKNVIAGRGGFSFRTEALDLAFRADGKKFSLFSGQSPVGLGGYFAAPAINPISPQLLTRAGVGLGLGLVATPIGAVLAFVDVGDAKAAACGPVLAGATAAQQRTVKGKPRDDVGTGTAKVEDKGERKKILGIF
ncbi:AsmA family protein [Sphingomonas sp. Leaf357]|uniref:AsmA family protein n=1 Tax=Sphingomonas sp. Leaf357 TaxID=1736350 RepID=UPI0006F4036B|nr:AsmA family protein [Sphingomonas sp. Leaf357]KQS03142.1 AsmA family protein [Sphingomonas sp. Leaf357]